MNSKVLSLYHIVKMPTIKKANSSVLFMLHGYGSNEEDLFSFAPQLPDSLCVISVRAPYDIDTYGHAWYTINFDADLKKWSDNAQARRSRDQVLGFIEEACEAYTLNIDNVTLLGFSQGTILSYAIALSYPEKIKNVIALSGYVNEDILLENYADKDHSKLHFYCSHGSQDQVIPVAWARHAPKLLKQLHIAHSYEEFPVGHGVAPQNFYAFNTWLSDKI